MCSVGEGSVCVYTMLLCTLECVKGWPAQFDLRACPATVVGRHVSQQAALQPVLHTFAVLLGDFFFPLWWRGRGCHPAA